MKKQAAAASQARQPFSKPSGPPEAGVSIERCHRADLTRLQNLWQERELQQMPGGACSGRGQVVEAWKVDNPRLAYEFKQRREELKRAIGREADKLEGYHGTHP